MSYYNAALESRGGGDQSNIFMEIDFDPAQPEFPGNKKKKSTDRISVMVLYGII